MNRQKLNAWSTVSTTNFREDGKVLMELESSSKTRIMRIPK
jgi:hypothetical protein